METNGECPNDGSAGILVQRNEELIHQTAHRQAEQLPAPKKGAIELQDHSTVSVS